LLTSFRQIHFRSHDDTTVRLEPLTVFVGPAGSGKSNVFKALVFVQNTVHRNLPEIFPSGLGEFRWVRSRWAEETDPIGFELELDGVQGGRARYELKLADSPGGVFVLAETLSREVDGTWHWVFERRSSRNPRPMGAFGTVGPYDPTILHLVKHRPPAEADGPDIACTRDVATYLSRIAYYHLEVSSLKEPGEVRESEVLRYWGAGLPEFISWAKSQPDGSTYAKLRGELREVLPHLDEIVVNAISPDRQGVAMSFRGYNGFITARDLSDGTMLTLGILCVLHSGKQPKVLCIEEPEVGLHPRRLRWLFEKLVAAAFPTSGERPVQVLLTTHSPYVVDLFRDMQSAVQVVDHEEGRSRITSLVEIKKKLRERDAGDPIGHEWATGLFEGL
jgi:predicted ATPase